MTRMHVWLGVGLVISFFAARAIHAARLGDDRPAAPQLASAAAPPPAVQAARDRAGTASRPRPDSPQPGIAVPASLEQEVRATSEESADARDVRHETQLALIRQRAPELPLPLVTQLVGIADGVADQQRRLRTSFMLGELPEDEYLDARRQAVRDSFHAARAVLTKDQFTKVFQWSTDADPFDPEGSTAPQLPIDGASSAR